MSEKDFWESTPRKIMTLLIHKGLETGAYTSKEAKAKEQTKNAEMFMKMAGV